MDRCRKCNGYKDSGYGLCPECRRNDILFIEQEGSKIRLQHDAHLKNVISKLLDLAIESVEDSNKAEKKVKIIMKSAVFTDNEYNFFPEIEANIFLADCYYKTRLSSKPSLDSIKKLPNYALEYIPTWVRTSEDRVYPKKVLSHYEAYQSELKAEEKLREEEWKKSEKNRKNKEAKQRKADEIREREEEEKYKIESIKGRKIYEEKMIRHRRLKYILLYPFYAIASVLVLLFFYNYFREIMLLLLWLAIILIPCWVFYKVIDSFRGM